MLFKLDYFTFAFVPVDVSLLSKHVNEELSSPAALHAGGVGLVKKCGEHPGQEKRHPSSQQHHPHL